METLVVKPLRDHVLVKREEVTEVRGLILAGTSRFKFTALEVGPDVEGIERGDELILGGTGQVHQVDPDNDTLVLLSQELIAAVVTRAIRNA